MKINKQKTTKKRQEWEVKECWFSWHSFNKNENEFLGNSSIRMYLKNHCFEAKNAIKLLFNLPYTEQFYEKDFKVVEDFVEVLRVLNSIFYVEVLLMNILMTLTHLKLFKSCEGKIHKKVQESYLKKSKVQSRKQHTRLLASKSL